MPHFIFIQQISVLNILNMLYNLHFFSSKCRLFHNATLFGFCITHILNTGCAKIWKKKKKSVAKRLNKGVIVHNRILTSGAISSLLRYFDLVACLENPASQISCGKRKKFEPAHLDSKLSIFRSGTSSLQIHVLLSALKRLFIRQVATNKQNWI
jgi:hypothetical protein